jgi:hypothetical protein
MTSGIIVLSNTFEIKKSKCPIHEKVIQWKIKKGFVALLYISQRHSGNNHDKCICNCQSCEVHWRKSSIYISIMRGRISCSHLRDSWLSSYVAKITKRQFFPAPEVYFPIHLHWKNNFRCGKNGPFRDFRNIRIINSPQSTVRCNKK